jgi:hypothetical protein
VLRTGSLILRGVSWGVSGDEGWCWISFLHRLFFVKESVLGGDVYFGGCCPQGCFLGCLFSGVPPIYDVSSLYSQFHRSLLVLSTDLVV